MCKTSNNNQCTGKCDIKGDILRTRHNCDGEIEKSVPRITVWHHKGCGMTTNIDPKGQIVYHIPTQIMDSFSCSPLNFAFLF